MRKNLLFSFLLLFFTTAIFAQSKKVTGKVTATDDDSGLPGVSVYVKGTAKGTVTDASGSYSIEAANGQVLVFSFVGMANKEVTVGNQSAINVALSSADNALNEVVVTALGITREKKSLGYATQELKGDAVNTAKETNFVNSLSGKAAGIDIKRNNNLGASTNVVIRGFKSLTGNNQALFVVDGIPMDNQNTNSANTTSGRGGYDYGNAASDINPDDIESINILKGAAATALYGSRAANGVVMVTTKKGKANKGIGITFNMGYSLGMPDKSTLPTYQNQYGGGYGNYYEDPSKKFLYRDINKDGVMDLVVPLGEDASWGAKFDPAKMVYTWSSFDPSSPNYGKTSPWVAAANDANSFLNNSKTQNYSLALDGGNEKGTYRVAYTRLDQTGILPNSTLQKNGINFSGTYDFSNKLTATTNFNYIRQDGKGRYSNGYNDNIMTSFRQWYQTNVDILEQKAAFERTGNNVTWNWADPSDLKPIYWDNPYWQRYNNYETDWRNRLYGNIALEYKINDIFNVLGRVNMDTYTEQQEERFAVGTITNSGVAAYKRFDHTYTEKNYDLILRFNKALNSDFHLSGLIGGNIRRLDDSKMRASTTGGLVVPNVYSLGNSASAISAPAESQYSIYQTGIFANASVGYKDYLYLDASLRRDVSSTLPVNNNTYYYPSISGSLIFSNLMDSPWLSFGKFRANYAEVGNGAPAQSILDTYIKPTNLNADNRDAFGGQSVYQTSAVKNNPDLRPERTKSFEIGLEMKFLKNRAGFDLALYRAQSVDQIMDVAISKSAGYDRKYVNAGTIENKGIELSVFGVPLKRAGFEWKSTLNFTLNRNKVVALYDGVDNLQIASFGQGVTLNAAVGEAYGTLRGTDFVYKNGQKVVLATGYYQRSAANSIIGNINPDFKIGFNNAFTYKNIMFSFLLDYQKGGSLFSLDQAYGRATGLYAETVMLNDKGVSVREPIASGGGYIFPGVLEDGVTQNARRVSGENYGLLGYVRNPNAAFIYDASYLKLREVAITIPVKASIFGGENFVKGLTVSITGRNLWIIQKNLPYADPEDGLSSGNTQGYQVGAYPSLREVGANLKFIF